MFNNYNFHQKKLTNDEMDTKYNISYDNQKNKVFQNVDNFLQYLRHLCKEHCNNLEDLYSIEEFLNSIYNDTTSWYCQMCEIQLIGYQDGYIYYHKKSCVDHYHKWENKKGPIRGLLCNNCNIKEGDVKKKVENNIDYDKLVKIPHFEKVIYYWEKTGHYNGITMDTRPD